tara:strand:- start:645 stop:1031 length:387 start_codon:yes stop_codon:yes gene_type:complete
VKGGYSRRKGMLKEFNMPHKPDPILVFRDEIMAKIIKNKLIELAYENKGSFETLNDFYDQFRERYQVSVSNIAIKKWMTELELKLASSFTFLDEGRPSVSQPPRNNNTVFVPDGDPSEADLDVLFDNE